MPLNEGLVKECQHEFIRNEVHRLQHKYSVSTGIGGDILEAINSKGWVYILSSPCMSDLLKVGMTTSSPYVRAKELSSSTGVPEEFVVGGACFSNDPRGDESATHFALNAHRISESKKFFKCSLAKAREVCRFYCLCDAKSILEEFADGYAVICADQPIKLNLREWFEEFGVSTIGCTTSVLGAAFELGYEQLEDMSRDGISIIIEDGGIRSAMSESHQSLLAYLEEVNEREKLVDIYGPRLPEGS